jgi:hypothetical protein
MLMACTGALNSGVGRFPVVVVGIELSLAKPI